MAIVPIVSQFSVCFYKEDNNGHKCVFALPATTNTIAENCHAEEGR